MFGMVNRLLSKLAESTDALGWMFRLFTRILPVPQAVVRGVPIKAVLPLNEYGVFATFRTWEKREPETLDWIDAFEEDSIFFDIGSGFGTETLYAALKVGGPRKIICFDCGLSSSFNLAMNLQINRIESVDQYYLALSDRSRAVSVSEHTNYASVAGRPRYDKIALKTWSTSVDEFVERTGNHPDYIKIDVDGEEAHIVEGMRRTLGNAALKAVLVEVDQDTQELVTRRLQAAGFELAYQSEERQNGGATRTKNMIFSRPTRAAG